MPIMWWNQSSVVERTSVATQAVVLEVEKTLSVTYERLVFRNSSFMNIFSTVNITLSFLRFRICSDRAI